MSKPNKAEMTDTEKIRYYFAKWEWFVIKWGWRFDVNYCESYEDMPSDASYSAAALAFSEWQYLTAQIYINIKKVSTMNDSDIEYMVVHELTHLLLAPMQDSVDNEEMSATTIARIIKSGLYNFDAERTE